MTQKLNSILLIDDDEPTNFLHQLVINQTDCANHCKIVESGQEALEYLNDSNNPIPDMILLDINMPIMNGWDFLDVYQNLDMPHKDKIMVVMLTTSISLHEEEKAKSMKVIQDFRRKPLTTTMLKELVEAHFSASIS
ncbi:MAG: response regulator [Raineya sp.]|jgi:CheY-like chemotaxis protein|nr:response regulator [Raineya sp.]